MPFGSLLLILALLFIVGYFLAQPFLLAPKKSSASQEEKLELLAERERVLEALLELDFDQQLGKVPQRVFESQREQLVRRGAEILEKLDNRSTEFERDALREESLEAIIAAHKAERES